MTPVVTTGPKAKMSLASVYPSISEQQETEHVFQQAASRMEGISLFFQRSIEVAMP